MSEPMFTDSGYLMSKDDVSVDSKDTLSSKSKTQTFSLSGYTKSFGLYNELMDVYGVSISRINEVSMSGMPSIQIFKTIVEEKEREVEDAMERMAELNRECDNLKQSIDNLKLIQRKLGEDHKVEHIKKMIRKTRSEARHNSEMAYYCTLHDSERLSRRIQTLRGDKPGQKETKPPEPSKKPGKNAQNPQPKNPPAKNASGQSPRNPQQKNPIGPPPKHPQSKNTPPPPPRVTPPNPKSGQPPTQNQNPKGNQRGPPKAVGSKDPTKRPKGPPPNDQRKSQPNRGKPGGNPSAPVNPQGRNNRRGR